MTPMSLHLNLAPSQTLSSTNLTMFYQNNNFIYIYKHIYIHKYIYIYIYILKFFEV
jgi:hypothetical protein